MAKRIGLERRKYQGDHYDLSMAKRALAVRCGAVQLTMRQLAALVFLRRRGQFMGDPETAVDRMRALKKLMNASGTQTVVLSRQSKPHVKGESLLTK